MNDSTNSDKVLKKFLLIHKTNGKFCNIYGTDAYVINYLFGYKVLDNKKCGFPNTALNKVINKLEESKISYQIINVDSDPLIKNYKNLNSYNNILNKALEKISLA